MNPNAVYDPDKHRVQTQSLLHQLQIAQTRFGLYRRFSEVTVNSAEKGNGDILPRPKFQGAKGCSANM